MAELKGEERESAIFQKKNLYLDLGEDLSFSNISSSTKLLFEVEVQIYPDSFSSYLRNGPFFSCALKKIEEKCR